jgi:hypothetical protein
MWKIVLGFIVFAAVALFVVMKGGDKLDMAGEAGEHSTSQAPASPAGASSSDPASSPSAPAEKK